MFQTHRTESLEDVRQQQYIRFQIMVVVVLKRATIESVPYILSPLVIFIAYYFLAQIAVECRFRRQLGFLESF